MNRNWDLWFLNRVYCPNWTKWGQTGMKFRIQKQIIKLSNVMGKKHLKKKNNKKKTIVLNAILEFSNFGKSYSNN